jgi:hypothetical protein
VKTKKLILEFMAWPKCRITMQVSDVWRNIKLSAVKNYMNFGNSSWVGTSPGRIT